MWTVQPVPFRLAGRLAVEGSRVQGGEEGGRRGGGSGRRVGSDLKPVLCFCLLDNRLGYYDSYEFDALSIGVLPSAVGTPMSC
ncbi:hypothetical protein CBR_g40152 [Chara braunii]|uniref:Uncharacterized protein n=1 Tax=Chara braunii TaxID=69332 RepID=A0A388LTE6_CHABU|nr:hypothetical protein CBR_g40152 [Chara braunii]|eukprot:GBG85513.1 hypothetical protein CBR_g40152 [Chara braunii]